MAYTTIDDPSAHFQTVIYTGGGDDSSVTFGGNSDLQLDWLWVKRRDSSNNSKVFDTSRGIGDGDEPYLTTVSDEEEQTYAYLTSVDSDGFTWDTTDASTGASGNTYVAWGWKANGGSSTGSAAESGDNPAYNHQANTTAGFSIITYTGTGATGTIAHGLGAVPELIICKQRSNAESWGVYHGSNTAAPETDYLLLDTTAATADNSNRWGDTAPTSSVFTVDTANEVNTDGRTYVAYVFTSIQGYSKFGSYTGNGNADGPFVYTGFKPAWVMVKDSSNTGAWTIFDKKRGASMGANDHSLKASDTDAEYTSENWIGFVSNGFKLEGTNDDANGSSTYVYLAFADQPFVTSGGVPCTAR
jgi:hypothetical protein